MRSPSRRPRTVDPDHPAGLLDPGVVDEPHAAGGREVALLDEDALRDIELRAEIVEAARSRRAPLVMTAVTAGVGAGTWGCAQIAEALAGPGGSTAVGVTVWLGTALAVPTLRAVLRERILDRWVRTWWASTACAAAWVDVVTVQGPALLTPGTGVAAAATLVLGSAALSARWFDEHEVPAPGELQPQPAPTPLPVAPHPPVDTSQALTIEQDWYSEVAAGKAPVAPSSELTERTPLPHGWRWVVQLDRGESVSCTDLENDGVTARIALKLGLRATHVMLERLEGDRDREDLAMLTVVTRDVLATGVPYRGPRYDRGVIAIGDFADGTGEATWMAYDGTGVLCGLVGGGQGSGKSALLALLGLAYRRSGEWIVAFGDGDEQGGSSRLLGEVAHDFARGPRQVLEQLQAVEAWGRVRGELMGTLTTGPDGKPTPITRPGQRPVDKIMPCPAFPGLVWTLDEFHRLANDPYLQSVNFVDRVEMAVRILRKYGGAVIIGTQSMLGDDFDGNSALRGMLASGNTAALRTKNKSEQGIVTDGLAPNMLPKGGGYAFLGEGDRRAMIRVAFSEDMHLWAAEAVQYGQPDRRSWAAFRRYRQVRELDPVAEYEERMAALAAIDEAIATGAPLPGSAEARAAEDEQDVDHAPVSVAGLGVPTLNNVIPIRPDVEPEPPAVQVTEKAQRVLDALRSRPGPWRSAEIREATGLSAPDVSKALKALVEQRLAHRPSGVQGVYQAGPSQDPLTDQKEII